MRRMCSAAVCFLFLFCAVSPVLPASAFTPWRTMIKAGKDERKGMDIRQDSVLKRDIKSALSRSGKTEGADITVAVYMGHAFLVGTVIDPAQPRVAHEVAAGTPGVRSVGVYLPERSALPETGHSDTALAAEIKGVFLADPSLVASRYEVRVVGGVAVVMGIAGSDAQRKRAAADARGVEGISEVVDFILLPEPEYEKRTRQRLGILR